LYQFRLADAMHAPNAEGRHPVPVVRSFELVQQVRQEALDIVRMGFCTVGDVIELSVFAHFFVVDNG
jgi:hypothetical protein